MICLRNAGLIPCRNLSLIISLLMAFVVLAGCSSNPSDPDGNGSRPTGTLYVNGDVKANTYSINLQTGATTNLFAGVDPFRTPEGTFIVRTFNGLEEVSANGTTSRMIVREQIQEPFADKYDNAFHNPQLSPDGQYIAYEGQFGFVFDVYVVDRYTGELMLSITEAETGLGYTRPSWTPDNRLVVAGTHSNPGIFITNTDWTSLTRIDANLTFPDQPQVSPDGTKIALIVNAHVYTMNIDGTGLTQVTTSSSSEEMPTWSRDGKSIGVYGNNSILLLNLAGGTIFDLRTISTTMDHFMTFTSFRGGQFYWQQ